MGQLGIRAPLLPSSLSSWAGCLLAPPRRDDGGVGSGLSVPSDPVESESTDTLCSGRGSAAPEPFFLFRRDISSASLASPPLDGLMCCLFRHRMRNMIPMTRIRIEKPVTIPKIRPIG